MMNSLVTEVNHLRNVHRKHEQPIPQPSCLHPMIERMHIALLKTTSVLMMRAKMMMVIVALSVWMDWNGTPKRLPD
jgi:hypothetical protein